MVLLVRCDTFSCSKGVPELMCCSSQYAMLLWHHSSSDKELMGIRRDMRYLNFLERFIACSRGFPKSLTQGEGV